MMSRVLKCLLALGLLVGCGSSESASGKTRGDTGDGGPAAGGNAVMSGSGGSIGAAGKPTSAGGTGGVIGSGGVSGGQSSGGAMSTGGAPSGGGAASGGSAPSSGGAGGAGGDVSCDPRKILCKRVAPECGQMEVPSVEGSCYGPCVAIGKCACTAAEECPDSSQYTCNRSSAHCTPYLL
jgi:hypothetical protein